MKNVNFYVSNSCANVMFGIEDAEIICSGEKLEALVEKESIPNHEIQIQDIEDDYFITIKHEMSKEHYISFIACVGLDRVVLVKLYPEQNAEIRIPKRQGNKILAFCNKHGLWGKAIPI